MRKDQVKNCLEKFGLSLANSSYHRNNFFFIERLFHWKEKRHLKDLKNENRTIQSITTMSNPRKLNETFVKVADTTNAIFSKDRPK